MHALIIGAAGMIGRKLAASLAASGLDGAGTLERMTLADVVTPAAPEGFGGAVRSLAVDLADAGSAERLIGDRPDIVFHLAAIVSGEAEADLEKGYRVNLDGTRALFDAIRLAHGRDGWTPRVVYASSNAVFGGDFPEVIGDEFVITPQTSYGTQKLIGELLLADYSRRGFFGGVGIRLPTICVRPGRPNAAASGFFSGIIREPLVGMEAVLPVPETTRHWFASPRSAVGFLRHAAVLDLALLGDRPSLSMPGLSATVGEQIEALRAVAGDGAVGLIRRAPDAAVARIVSGWARAFDPARARALGFVAETQFEEIVRAHIEDELGGRVG